MLTKIIYSPIGWLYLWITFRNKQKVKEVLTKKYEDSYEVAGSEELPTVIGGVAIIGIALFLLGVIKTAIFGEVE